MTPFKWIKMFIYPHQGDFDFSKHWLQAVCIFFNKWKYGVNNGFRWWKFFYYPLHWIKTISSTMERIDLSSLPFFASSFQVYIWLPKKKKEKKRRVGALVGCCCPVYQIFS